MKVSMLLPLIGATFVIVSGATAQEPKDTRPIGSVTKQQDRTPRVEGGHETGHGGHAVSCPGKPVVVLEYYQAGFETVGGDKPRLLDVEDIDIAEYTRRILSNHLGTPDLHHSNDMDLPRKLLGYFDSIPPVGRWKAGALNSVPTANLNYPLCPGGELLQAAMRFDRVMWGDPAVIRVLSSGQRHVLRLHEILFAFISDHGLETSESVRDLMDTLLDAAPTENDKYFSIASFLSKVQEKLVQDGGIWTCSVPCFRTDSTTELSGSTDFRADTAYETAKRYCEYSLEGGKARGIACSVSPWGTNHGVCPMIPLQNDVCVLTH